MLIKKIFLNLFIFSILIGGFVYAYFKFDNTAQATTLIFCIKNDYTNYITLDSDQACPSGYFLAPADFNLNLLVQATSTPTLEDIYSSAISSGTDGTSTGGGSYNNATNTSDNNGGFYDSDGVYHPNPDNSNPYDINFNNSNSNPTSTNPDTYYQNGNYNSGNYTSPNYDSNIFNVNPNPVIAYDPTLEHGPFENLDPRDYPYCVLLKHDMTIGMNDSNTGREVSALQKYLYDRGYANNPATGIYDQYTVLAVKRFQYRNQIEVSGIVKADMRDIIQELTCVKYPVISYQDKPISPEVITVKLTPTYTTTKTTTPATTPKPKPTPAPVTTPKPKPTPIPEPEPTEKPTEEDTSKVVIIPETNTEANQTSIISPVEGNMYLSIGNNLYFTYQTKSATPYICLAMGNTDCSDSGNYNPLNEGITTGLYEAINFTNYWSFNLYNGLTWGSAGDKVRIYLKDNRDSSNSSIYIVNVLN